MNIVFIQVTSFGKHNELKTRLFCVCVACFLFRSLFFVKSSSSKFGEVSITIAYTSFFPSERCRVCGVLILPAFFPHTFRFLFIWGITTETNRFTSTSKRVFSTIFLLSSLGLRRVFRFWEWEGKVRTAERCQKEAFLKPPSREEWKEWSFYLGNTRRSMVVCLSTRNLLYTFK